MTEFSVDVAALRDMSARLKALKEDFESQDETVKGYEDAVGSPAIAGALDEFANNWSDKRKEIGKMIEDVARYAEKAADAYQDTEDQISASIEDSSAGARRARR